MYRIKVVELPDSNEYYPQYKFLFFWFNFETHQGAISFKNMTDCKKFIQYQKKLKKKKTFVTLKLMIDKEKTRKKCNILLEAMVGPSLVAQWWDSRNKHWDLRTPNEVFEENPQSVFNYLLSHAFR